MRDPAPGVLRNDVDPDGDDLTVVLVSDASDGILTLSSDGSFTYQPNPGFAGTDTFSYRASDGALESEPVEVSILVGNE